MATLSSATSQLGLKASLSLTNDSVAGQMISPTALLTSDKNYASDTDPVGSQYIGQTETLAGTGAVSDTLDLTSLTDPEGASYDGSGKRIQEIRISAPATNVGDIVVSGGDSDPYYLFGTSNEFDIEPGMVIAIRADDNLPIIATSTAVTATDIKFAGTSGDVYTYQFIIG